MPVNPPFDPTTTLIPPPLFLDAFFPLPVSLPSIVVSGYFGPVAVIPNPPLLASLDWHQHHPQPFPLRPLPVPSGHVAPVFPVLTFVVPFDWHRPQPDPQPPPRLPVPSGSTAPTYTPASVALLTSLDWLLSHPQPIPPGRLPTHSGATAPVFPVLRLAAFDWHRPQPDPIPPSRLPVPSGSTAPVGSLPIAALLASLDWLTFQPQPQPRPLAPLAVPSGTNAPVLPTPLAPLLPVFDWFYIPQPNPRPLQRDVGIGPLQASGVTSPVSSFSSTRTVYADVTINFNIVDIDTQNTIAAGGTVCAFEEVVSLYYGYTPYPVSIREWSYPLSFTGGVQTYDLMNLPSLRGVPESFTTIFAIYVYNLSATSGTGLVFGNAPIMPFSAFFDASTDTYTIPSGSRWYAENRDTGWFVDPTHRDIKFDPLTKTFLARIIIIGI